MSTRQEDPTDLSLKQIRYWCGHGRSHQSPGTVAVDHQELIRRRLGQKPGRRKTDAAINEVKDSRAGMSAAKLKEVGSYIQETKTILDRVMEIGEIGKKALPMILKAAAMVGLRLL